MSRTTVVLLLACVCSLTSSAFAAPIINLDITIAQVCNANSTVTDSHNNTLGVAAGATLPGYSSTTTSAYSPASFSATLEQSRTGLADGFSYGEAQVEFTPDSNIPYAASGIYSNSGGKTVFLNYLYDFTASTTLFYSEQISEYAPATFAAGGLAGNLSNSFIGSLTGVLAAGHNYRWYGVAYSRALAISDGPATSSGNFSMTLGAVPEPGSIATLSALTLMIGIQRRRMHF